jgi:hypothetical protein
LASLNPARWGRSLNTAGSGLTDRPFQKVIVAVSWLCVQAKCNSTKTGQVHMAFSMYGHKSGVNCMKSLREADCSACQEIAIFCGIQTFSILLWQFIPVVFAFK